MKSSHNFLLLILVFILTLIQESCSNEVLGCGGFIKSHADIDFSKVEIKLLSKQGSLKDKTDCSPSNGYYFIPVYDKGDYLLKISPPPGWSFEPEEVEFNFNGKTDICSQGKDVNFVFKGFGITGKVALAGHGASGAKNVAVELKSEDGSDVRQTTTNINGIFSFTPIIPGKYVIKASHPKWHFSKAEHTVVVLTGNTELPENSLVVSGFDASGRIDTNGQLSSGIGIALFKERKQKLQLKCTKGSVNRPFTLTSAAKAYESSSVCYTEVDKSGDYKFKGLAPGKYVIQPVVENIKSKLHITPSHIEFEVLKDTLLISEIFQITGFSVSGKVLSGEDGEGVVGAEVKVNGEKVATTKKDGIYTLENFKAGTYNLQVVAPKVQFNDQQVKVQLSNPTFPDVIASAYEICGTVLAKKSYVIGITKYGSTFHTTVSSKAETGEWCTYLPKGKFIFEVVTTDADKASGIQFFPVKQNIEVKASPLSGITFSQLRAVLNGEIQCLSDSSDTCTEAEVTLHSLDSAGQPTGQKQTAKAQKGKYTFKDVLPGPYELTIPQSNLCFDSTRVLVYINSATETAVPFVHRGYEISIIASHRAMMKYSFVDVNEKAKRSTVDSMKLLSGVNTFCVTKAGEYTIKLEGCHIYDESLAKTFSTTDKNPLIITAVAHKIGMRILSTEQNVELLKLAVESEKGQQVIAPTQESHKVDGYFAFRFDTFLKSQEVLKISPKSDVLLFQPETRDLIGSDDCVDVAFNFIATKGLIIRGKVVPVIKDAKVSLSFPKNPEILIQTVLTSSFGEFKFGPINGSLEYELSAEKESYVFSEYNRTSSSFRAHKLCEIIVTVKDEKGSKLGGVLLSLSGGESYRKNLVTGDNGAIIFHSLSPSQYFLRPMMKEYKFEPNSKMIEIKDGETIEIELVGRRVAYSVFGLITSLNGDPFGQVNIEAVSDDKCMHHQEETTSENNGQYRIRGLQPSCSYSIHIKEGNLNVERSIPAARSITVSKDDVRNVNLIAISPITIVDVTARVTAPINEHYKSLRVQMYRKGSADSPIYSQRVETPLNTKSNYNPGIMVFFPRIPLDGKTYFVELKTTISDKIYTYNLPVIQFTANTSSIFVELAFKPEVRTAESDLNQNSISALILVALLAIAFFKQDIAMDFISFIWSKITGIANEYALKQQNSRKKEVRKAEPINYKEIEQMADQINSIKKKKAKKI